MNPKNFRTRVLVLALTLMGWTGSGSSQMDDNSDWWSLLREVGPDACSTLSKEKPDGANFVIAGVDLRHADPIRDAEEKVAKTSEIMTRGDAGTGRTQICFKSASEKGRFKLIFEEGAGGLPSAAYLIDGGPDWLESYKCVASKMVSEKLATSSGLHLGMTAAEVEKTLGKPCLESNDDIEYAFDYQYLLPLDERERLRSKGVSDVDEPVDWFGTMQIKFRGAKAYYIAILTGYAQ
jgi:hypothetical protein